MVYLVHISLVRSGPVMNVKVVEHKSPTYPPRTYHNAATAQLTVAFADDFETRGEKLTHKAAGEKYIPIYLGTDTTVAARELYKKCKTLGNVEILNVAGNGIYSLKPKGWTQDAVNQWVYDVISLVHKHLPFKSIISGGQTGVDLAGGVACEALGIPGVMTLPKGFKQRNADGVEVEQTEEDVIAQVLDGLANLKI